MPPVTPVLTRCHSHHVTAAWRALLHHHGSHNSSCPLERLSCKGGFRASTRGVRAPTVPRRVVERAPVQRALDITATA